MARWTFTPNCMTSDGTTFYGHAVYSFMSGSSERTIVLAKSNANPASFSNVTWTLVATAKESDLGYLSGMNILKTILCNVNRQGVFTIIASSTKKSPTDPENFPQGGYQFAPDADGSSGGGSWSKVSMTEPYPWDTIGQTSLTSVPGANGGKDVLVHVFSTSTTGDTISISIFDPVTKAFAIKSTWTLPIPGHAYYIEAQGGNVGVLSLLFPGLNGPRYHSLPLGPTGAAPANQSITTLNFTIPTGCSSLFMRQAQTCLFGNTFYYICQSSPSNVNYLVSTDGKKNSESIRTGFAKQYNDIYPIGPAGGPAVWGMMTNFSDYSGVVLSGPNAGAFQSMPKRMSIDGLPGNGDIWDDDTGGGGGGGGDGGGLSTGAVVGIIVGVLLCIISLSSICRILTKSKKHHLVSSRPTSPVQEDPDAFVPNINEIPEAKMECDILPMAPITPVALPSGTGVAGVGSEKNSATSSVLPPPTFAPSPPLNTELSQVATQQTQSLLQSSSLSPPIQNSYEDGYQRGFQQALLDLQAEQEQQQQQQQQDHQRPSQNPQLRTISVPQANPLAAAGAQLVANSNNTATTMALAPNNQQQYAQSNNPQYYAQSNSPQYYEQQQQHQHQQYQQQQQQNLGYYQIGAIEEPSRNPQVYNTGMPLSPLPAYSFGSATMSPVPSYAGGPGSSASTHYTPSEATSQAWTPDSTFSSTVPGSSPTQRPGNQGLNPSYHQ